MENNPTESQMLSRMNPLSPVLASGSLELVGEGGLVSVPWWGG